MKALILTETIKSDCGTGRYSFCVLKEYPELGVDPVILTTNKDSAIFHKEVPILRPLKGVLDFIVNIYYSRRHARSIKNVHAFDVWPYGVYGYFSVIFTDKNLFVNGVGTYSLPPCGLSFKRFVMNLALRRAKKIYCISDYTALRLNERVPNARTEFISLGLTRLPKVTDLSVKRIKQAHGLDGHYPIILTVGQLKSRKGQLDTLRAVQKLKTKFPNIIYIMLGSQSDKNYTNEILSYAKTNALEDNILMVSDAGDEDMATLYSISHIFCLNSKNEGDHFEGFGLAFLEAYQFGVPGVGSMDCGIESAIEDGYSGLLARQGDADDIADKISLVLAKREEMGNNAKQWVNKFDWLNTAKKYISKYE